ncbi:Beta-lactamase hydrolase-like protein [Aquimixticola soesokkakensis]|uniref:Beta-lactamase hydrolase-like protein n=1 Tax=Aquimixticola soesokkakensis TaxID=1519096 RepID=A0A1Y5SMW4_9RHOB|nr:TIGR01244 family sulfur transferase [Aquimixticola soesokkakensis]SLN44008.1 Beta-lactamase hydrolase-like protein [Aquimixticola soesokkakensis]
MKIKRLNGMFTISTQVDPDKIGKLAGLGYRSIICNRPDDEEPGQPSFRQIDAMAKQHGIVAIYLPIVLSDLSDVQKNEFSAAIEVIPKPIVAYCRTGARSAALWNDFDARQNDYTGRERRRKSAQDIAPLTQVAQTGAQLSEPRDSDTVNGRPLSAREAAYIARFATRAQAG